MRYCLLLWVCFSATFSASAQQLQRRVFLGTRLENITDDARKIMELNLDGGVLVSEVFAQSTAEAAGLKKGDVLYKMNGQVIKTPAELISLVARQTAGGKFSYELYRDKKPVTGSGIFKAMPEESYEGIEMIYTEAKTELGNERMIISKPANKTGKLPAVVFIGGIGCYSLDLPFDPNRSEVKLLNALTRAGFMCVRAEKPGMGDNVKTSKSCAEVSFMEEANTYVDMVNAIRQRTDVDPSSIYVFGHSMGGVFAPLVAEKTDVKGIIAYGALGSNFLEYLMKTRKTIAEAYKMNPEESDKLVKDYCECATWYFADKMTTEQAEKKKPGCKELLSIFDLRSREYNDQLYALSLPALWKEYRGKALFLWGSADYISSEDDHKMLAHAVNYYHPGNAQFFVVKNSDHGMMTASSFAESKNNPGVYNSEVDKIILNWLQHG